MSQRPDCPNCGHEIPTDAPADELCPKCLLRQVLLSFEAADTGRSDRDTSVVGRKSVDASREPERPPGKE